MSASFTRRCGPLIAALALSSPVAAERTSAETPGRLECVESWPEARYSGVGYDHWVHLQSSCDVPAMCAVNTDVNPDTVVVAVAPGEHTAVLTWRGSPAYEFTAWVECREASGE